MKDLNIENPEISVIILNYNTKKMTEECVVSYLENFKNKVTYEIILVDNNSNDGSEKYFKEAFELNTKIRMIFNKKNLGFGVGNNIGVKNSKGKYLVFANSDTLAEEFDILKMLDTLKKIKNIGILGCKIINANKSIQSVGFDFPSIINDFKLNFLFWNFNIIKKIRFFKYKDKGLIERDWISGSFFMCKKESFEKVGGFDSNIFMYSEDIDLCFRLKKEGMKNYVLDSEKIYHLHGKSGNKLQITLKKLIENKKIYRYVDLKNNISGRANLIFIMGVINATIIWSIKKICFILCKKEKN